MIADGLRIVMLGAPGAGKGTQAQRMVSHFGIPQISTGEIFRENLKRNTPLGREIKEFMEKGELVPDDIVLKIVEERLSHGDCAKGFILDGFPRTLGQAKAFDGDVDVSCVINLSVDDKVLLERLAGRRTCRASHKRSQRPKGLPAVRRRAVYKTGRRRSDHNQPNEGLLQKHPSANRILSQKGQTD